MVAACSNRRESVQCIRILFYPFYVMAASILKVATDSWLESASRFVGRALHNSPQIKSYKSCDLITNLINLSGVWREWSSKEMLVPKQLCFVAHIKRAFLSFLVPRHRFITSIICARGMPTLPTLHKTRAILYR